MDHLPKTNDTLPQEEYQNIFKVLKWGHASVSQFFKIIYCGKIWLTAHEGEQAVQHGWILLATPLH